MTDPFRTACNCLALRRAARLVTQLYDAELAPCGLRATQYSLLSVLHRRGRLAMGTLADALVMDRSTLGHNLRPLQRAGLVALHPDPDDGRARVLGLTRAGRSRFVRARRAWNRAQARFHALYGPAHATTLRTALERVVAQTVTM